MLKTDCQVVLNNELMLMCIDEGCEVTVGYMLQMMLQMIEHLPKRKQQNFIQQVKECNDRKIITVKNLLSGADVEIRRGDKGSCIDPSMERYHSM